MINRMSTSTKKSNKKTSPQRATARRRPSRSVKRKSRATALTVNTSYARVALVLLALNVLFTGYVVAKLTSVFAPVTLP